MFNEPYRKNPHALDSLVLLFDSLYMFLRFLGGRGLINAGG